MKRLLLFFVLFLSVFANAQVERIIPPRPNPPRLVNDFTRTLTPEQVQALEQKLVAYDDSTSNQVAVVIMNTISDYPIEDVALGILRGWGVGGRDHNNGIVILVAKDDHKIRIEVGYGLEGRIPDVTAKSIIDNDLTPNFREGNFYRGIDNAIDNIIKAAAGEYKAVPRHTRGRGLPIGGLFFLIIIIFSIFGSRGGGKGRGGMMSRRGSADFWTAMLIGSMLGRGGGGGYGGGGYGGGGFGGGGFGGFGGGGGGGGGASGGW